MKKTPTLEAWAQSAEPGARRVYARMTAAQLPDAAALREAWSLYESGVVTLVQRRGQGATEYVAVKLRKPAAVDKNPTCRGRRYGVDYNYGQRGLRGKGAA